MSCCGSARSTISGQQHSANNQVSTGQNNVYELATYPDCFNPYNGLHRADTVFIIGIQTEHERLFKKVHSKQALAYSAANGEHPELYIMQAPVTMVCSDAIEALYV